MISKLAARVSRRGSRALPAALCLALCVLLAACQVDLHTKATEVDANEMLGALLAAGLDARKYTPDGGKTWTISVEETQMVQAIDVLRDNALPRERRATLGDLFKKEGLISSPTEERVRFLYGVQQGLAETLSRIDGVIVARVHIVLPDNDPLATVTRPSSASVFVKYRRGAEIQALVPAIKNLVVHAVEGLDYSQVTVTPVAAAGPTSAEATLPVPQTAGPDGMAPWVLAAGAGLLALGLGLAAAVIKKRRGWLLRRPGASAVAATGDLVTADEPVR